MLAVHIMCAPCIYWNEYRRTLCTLYTIPIAALRNFLSLFAFLMLQFYFAEMVLVSVCAVACVIFRSFMLFTILLRSALYFCRASNLFVSFYILWHFILNFFLLLFSFLKITFHLKHLFSGCCKSTFLHFKWKSSRIRYVCVWVWERRITFANKPHIFIVNKSECVAFANITNKPSKLRKLVQKMKEFCMQRSNFSFFDLLLVSWDFAFNSIE